MIVTKVSQVDLNRSISTDLIHNVTSTSHKVNNRVGGLNALFPDGHVVYQTARANPKAFDPDLWTYNGMPIGNEPPPSKTWRTLMATWKP